MSEEKKRPGPKPTGKTPLRSIRVSDLDWEAWKKAAEFDGMSVSEWLHEIAKRKISRGKYQVN